MKNDLTLAQLAQAWLDAKHEEESAVAKRRQIGELLAAALPGPDEATATHKDAQLVVKVTRKLTRAVDADLLGREWEFIGTNVRNAFKWKADVNLKHLRALQELAAPELADVQKYITTKPAAASVSVELIQE